MSADLIELPTKSRRCYAHRSDYRYVRRVQGNAFQARVPLSGGRKWESVNLGLFGEIEHGSMKLAEWAAGRAAREFNARSFDYATGRQRDPWDVIQELQRLGFVPADVLPRWVYRLRTGAFGARCRRRLTGVEIDLTGPFYTPEAAHAAMRWWLLWSDPHNPYLPPAGGNPTGAA